MWHRQYISGPSPITRGSRSIIAFSIGCILSLSLLFYCGRYDSLSERIMHPLARNKDGFPGRAMTNLTNIQTQLIFYNRLPKCGSRSLTTVVRRISKQNNFKVASSLDYGYIRPSFPDMIEEIRKLARVKEPTFYDRHIVYLDFEKYGYKRPIYMNLIRDPIERFESSYNFHKYGDLRGRMVNLKKTRHLYTKDINECVKKNEQACQPRNLFYTGMYFCGMDRICATPCRRSVDLAKKHIDESYDYIGLTEEFEKSLQLLEKMFPLFFEGAVRDWSTNQTARSMTASHRHENFTETTKALLKSQGMAYEYEVYEYAKLKYEALKKKYRIL